MRGAHFTRTRRAIEWTLARVYRNGWPARVVKRVGLQSSLEVCEHEVRLPRWPSGAPPLRLVFASDWHAGPTTHPSLIREAIDAIRATAPDVLVLGGDYIYLHADYIHELAPLFADVRAPLGRFAVLGNHDVWSEESTIRTALENASVRVLVNEAVSLPAPYGNVALCGLDEPWAGEPNARATLETNAQTKILAMHAPEGLLVVGDESFDFAVCGHTHGGHIALPGGIPIVTAGPLSRRYSHGAYDLGSGRHMIVSKGIGATESPLRLFANPDIVVVRIGGVADPDGSVGG